MQHTVLYGAEPRGLPLNEKLMPQYFNEFGYVDFMISMIDNNFLYTINF